MTLVCPAADKFVVGVFGIRRASRSAVSTTIVAKGSKTDLKNSGTSGIKNDSVRNNIQGLSRYMEKKGWKDSQGNPGKVLTARSPRVPAQKPLRDD